MERGLPRTRSAVRGVLAASSQPFEAVECERGWCCFKGDPLDFSLTGVLASPAAPLAEAKASNFAASTYTCHGRSYMPRTISPVLLLAFALVPMFLLGCAASSETVEIPVAPPATFSDSGSEAVPDRWWTAFGSERLSATVDSALAENLDLRTAWQRLRAAQAVVDREAAALFPSLEGSAGGGTRQAGGAEAGADQNENLRLGLTSTYEVDLWGRIRSRVDAEQFRAEATWADYQTAALSLAAEVARTWFQLAEARSQVQLVNAQIETNLQVLRLQENRLSVGLVQGVDILRQRQLVEATREQRTLAESQVEVLEHQLAVLTGQPPHVGIETTPEALPTLPPLPETGVPIDLVRRRPDVRSAFLLLQAADRTLAAAIADQYPRLTLSASASVAADNAASLFENWATSFAGNLLAPIFLGGELRAEVDRVEAVKQQRLYAYGQATLVAFQEVEDALIREQKQREVLQRLDEQVDLAQRAYERLRNQYLNGTTDYLGVLTALDEVQQLRRDRLTARLTLVENRIALYRALAGSFETAREQ